MAFSCSYILMILLIILIFTALSVSDNKTSLLTSESVMNSNTSTSAETESTASVSRKDETKGYSIISTESDSSSTKTTSGDHNIDEVLDNEEHPWWFKDAIKDIAYYLRAHKFNEYDRRYNRNGSQVERTNFKYFPKPPLRALHWEVNKYCETSFLHCVDYLRKKLKQVALKRQDDTSVVAQENKWGLNESKEISQIDMECRRMRNMDDKVAPPFEGPLERYQWRTTASYFMCWYTMNEVPDLKHLEENCDNFAYCLDMSLGPSNNDTRADDSKPFSCAHYSFCPDPCCANKHLEQMEFCWDEEENPCFHENSAGQRECFFNRTQNTDFSDLILNRWNVTCKCPKQGFIWNSLYGLCVDIDECTSPSLHGCTLEGQACVNLPGSFMCICKWGYIYREKDKKCIASEALSEIKLNSQQTHKNETRNKWKLFIHTVVAVLGKSGSVESFNISTKVLLSMIILCWFKNSY